MSIHPKWKDKEQLDTLIDAYFRKCDLEDIPYTVHGLAIALGTSYHILWKWITAMNVYIDNPDEADWENVPYADVDDYLEMREALIIAKAKCEEYVAVKLLKNEINPAAGIFTLKAAHGWREAKDINVSAELKQQKIGNIQIIMPEDSKAVEGMKNEVKQLSESESEKNEREKVEKVNIQIEKAVKQAIEDEVLEEIIED